MKNKYLFKNIFFLLLFLTTTDLMAGNKYFISLDGGESFYVKDDASNHLDVSSAWTFEAWINVHSYSSGDYDCIMDRRHVLSFYLIDDDDDDYAVAFAARDGSDNIIAYMDCDGTGSTSANMQFDTWYHVAAIYDGTTAKLYVNGTEYDSDTDADWALTTGTGNTLNIGGRYWGSYSRQMTDADIDEVRVSDNTRSISVLQTDVSSEEYTSDANTVLLMHLDDQGDSPTYVSGTGLTGTIGDKNISSVDYVTILATNRLLQPKYQSKTTGNWSSASSWEYWDGSSSTWGNATLAPDYADDDISILNGHTITVASDITTNETTVENGGVLTVSSGNTLTISSNTDGLSISGEVNIDGSLTLNSGSNLVINSDVSYTGSMIVTGTLTNSGTITINRYLTAYTDNSDGWRFLSSPVSSFAIAGSGFAPTAGDDDLYEYDETKTTENWLNYTGGDFGDANFVVGKGYLCAYKSAATKQFTGDINTGSVTKNLSYTSGASSPGWNLLGNPYTAAIDWDLLGKTSSVDGAVYVVRASDGAYISWNGSTGALTDGIIPAMQGYFVKVTAASQSVTMEAADEVHATGTYYKTGAAENTLVVKVTGEKGESNAYIQFREGATKNFDHAIDAYKLFGYSKAPQIYTNDGENIYSINCLPLNVKDYVLPLAVKTDFPGDYTLDFTGIDNLADNDLKVKLTDLKLNTTVNISEGDTYAYTTSEGDDANRFELEFYSVTGINNPSALHQNINIYVSNNGVVIRNLDNKKLNGQVSVLNLLGQVVYTQQLSSNSMQTLHTDLNTGVYIVRLSLDDNSVMSKKLIIR